MQQADEWLLDVKERCQSKGGTSTTASSQTAITLNSAVEYAAPVTAITITITPTTTTTGGGGSNRRKGKEKEKDTSLHDMDAYFSKPRSAAPPLPTLSTKDALLALLQVGEGLGIRVDEELGLIRETVSAIERWDLQTLSALLLLDATQVAPLLCGYRDLMIVGVATGAAQMEVVREAETDIRVEAEGDLKMPCGVSILFKDPPFPSTGGLNLSHEGLDAAVGAKKEAVLWHSLMDFSSEVQRLKEQAADLGIGGGGIGAGTPQNSAASSSYLQLELCLSAIDWIGEARSLLCFPSASPSNDVHDNTLASIPAPVGLSITGRIDLDYKKADNSNTAAAAAAADQKEGSVDEREGMTAEKVKKPQRKQKSDTQAQSQVAVDVVAAASEPDTTDLSLSLIPDVLRSSLDWGDCCR